MVWLVGGVAIYAGSQNREIIARTLYILQHNAPAACARF